MTKVISKATYKEVLLAMINDLYKKGADPEDIESLHAAYESARKGSFKEVEVKQVDGKFTFKPILLGIEVKKEQASVELFDNEQAKALLSAGKKLTHEYFTSSEWVKGQNGMYEFEDGCLCSPNDFWNGREDFSPSWKIIE